MTYELYWVSGSPNSWRAMLTLEHKQIAYVSKRLDPTKGESKTPEYLALNPRGKVPTLRNGNFVLHESIAIMAYLDQVSAERPIFGTSPSETGLIWQRILEFINYARDPIDDGVSRPLMRGQGLAMSETVKPAAEAVHRALAWMDSVLSDNPFLAGERVSAADIAAIPNIQWLVRVGGHQDALALDLGLDDLTSSYRSVGRWVARLEKLPGYGEAYPPHWKNT